MKRKEKQLCHVVSVRVSNEELNVIGAIALESKKKVSDLIREALKLMPTDEGQI